MDEPATHILPLPHKIGTEVVIINTNAVGRIVSVATNTNGRFYSVRLCEGVPATWFPADSIFPR